MYPREAYLKQLVSFEKQTELIKVVTGIRRCGKSTLLDLYEQHLLAEGVSTASIVRMNFESMDFDHIRDYHQLYEYLLAHLSLEGITYYLLDEVQQVERWEQAVNSLRLKKAADIVITGSNAHLLSSELSTVLSGRYVEIKMLPLSFQEFLTFNAANAQADVEAQFNKYLEVGGFPGLTPLMSHPETIEPFLSGILNTIVMKDVVTRNAVRDAALLENLLRFVASSIGSPLSTKKISDYLTSAGRKTTSETIDNYLSMLEDAFIIYRAQRFDLKGKLLLKTNEKFYLTDPGLRTVLLGRRQTDYGHLLENVVYFELLRRGYTVTIGKLGTLEVDFVAAKADERKYFQVTATMLSDETRERELKPLQDIPDHYEKLVLSMDRTPIKDFNGIKNVNLLDFLLEQ